MNGDRNEDCGQDRCHADGPNRGFESIGAAGPNGGARQHSIHNCRARCVPRHADPEDEVFRKIPAEVVLREI